MMKAKSRTDRRTTDRAAHLLLVGTCLLALSATGCASATADNTNLVDAPQFLGDLARNLLAAWLF